MKATVFLGGGRITGALIAGLRLAGYKARIVVHDRNPHKLRALKREHNVIAEPDLGRAIAQAHLLIVAVRPDSVLGILEKDSASVSGPPGHQREGAILACSLAAGIPLAKLRAKLGPRVGWARAMPSPVCRAGRGLTAVTFERGASAAARKELKQFFGGEWVEWLEFPRARSTRSRQPTQAATVIAACGLGRGGAKIGTRSKDCPCGLGPRAGGRDYLLARGEHLTGCPAAGGSHPRWNRRHRDEDDGGSRLPRHCGTRPARGRRACT